LSSDRSLSSIPTSTKNDALESERLVHLLSHTNLELPYISAVPQPSPLHQILLLKPALRFATARRTAFSLYSAYRSRHPPRFAEKLSHTQYTHTCNADNPPRTHNSAFGKNNGRSRLEGLWADLYLLIDRSKTGQLQ